MFSATYLGQQGWLLAGARGRILVDPLLTEEYSPGFEAAIYPPRAFDLGADLLRRPKPDRFREVDHGGPVRFERERVACQA